MVSGLICGRWAFWKRKQSDTNSSQRVFSLMRVRADECSSVTQLYEHHSVQCVSARWHFTTPRATQVTRTLPCSPPAPPSSHRHSCHFPLTHIIKYPENQRTPDETTLTSCRDNLIHISTCTHLKHELDQTHWSESGLIKCKTPINVLRISWPSWDVWISS